jgi:large subunit ribosomal protein L24
MKHVKWKIKKGDFVEVVAGKEKGKRGNVISVDKKKERVYVEKVNLVKKHVKRREGQPGSISEQEAGIHVSNVMIIDPKTDKPSRIGFQILENGEKVRVAKKSGEVLDKG